MPYVKSCQMSNMSTGYVFRGKGGEAAKESGLHGTAESSEGGPVGAEVRAGMQFSGREWQR